MLFAQLKSFCEQQGFQRIVLTTTNLQADACDRLYPGLGFELVGPQVQTIVLIAASAIQRFARCGPLMVRCGVAVRYVALGRSHVRVLQPRSGTIC